jgi:molybdopterin-dependent oxidoreductase alpha subunit
VVAGQNPGTNHPRMLSALETAKRRGARILAINPLRESGLTNFKNPQHARGLMAGTALADLHLPIRINGDQALFQAIGSLLLKWDAIDYDFIRDYTDGFEEYAHHLRHLDRQQVRATTGLTDELIEEAAQMFRRSPATVICWAMGITQHRNSVATVRELVNVALLQGNIGRAGAGLCPVRGHSNVQGDRTMGITEQPRPNFLAALTEEFGFVPPQMYGLDAVASVRALRDHKAKVFIGMGGNFVGAMADTEVTEKAMRNAALTVHVSTKLNRSHVVTGRTALILPALGRSEQDHTGGRAQRVSVEDSMSVVHISRGPLPAASDMVRSEVDIVCSIAKATLPNDIGVPWSAFRSDYGNIRASIERVVPGAAGYAHQVLQPGGFVMPHPPRDTRSFPTKTGNAEFAANALAPLHLPAGRLLLQTLRSHDQFNTTIYGLDDRYRGVFNGRRVVFVNPDDVAALGLADGDLVDLHSEWSDNVQRVAHRFRVVAYEQPRGCAAAYYPETNPLVPLDSVALGSGTPTSKSVVVRLVPHHPTAPDRRPS